MIVPEIWPLSRKLFLIYSLNLSLKELQDVVYISLPLELYSM